MDLAIYDCAHGGVVLVAVPLLPPREALRVHGPLVARGRLRVPDPDAAPWAGIVMQLDRHLYAAIGAAEAAILLDGHALHVPDATP